MYFNNYLYTNYFSLSICSICYNKFYYNYYILFIIFIIYFIICFFIIFLSYLFVKKNSYIEKLSPYECGFEPFKHTRNAFHIQFYLIGLFFLIFDLESLYIYPLVYSISLINNFSFLVFLDFFLELILGYILIFKYIDID